MFAALTRAAKVSFGEMNVIKELSPRSALRPTSALRQAIELRHPATHRFGRAARRRDPEAPTASRARASRSPP